MLALPFFKLLKACLATAVVFSCCQEARVLFLPKTGRVIFVTVKDFRSISLTSFILTLMERLVDRYIREVPLVENSLCSEQHAYQEGK